jgi:hypothetical protein
MNVQALDKGNDYFQVASSAVQWWTAKKTATGSLAGLAAVTLG